MDEKKPAEAGFSQDHCRLPVESESLLMADHP
jgi:hypothetical protein